MSTTTTTTRDRRDRYGPIEWAQQEASMSTLGDGGQQVYQSSTTNGPFVTYGTAKIMEIVRIYRKETTGIMVLHAIQTEWVYIAICAQRSKRELAPNARLSSREYGTQGRRSLSDRGGACPPIFMKGYIHGNLPQYFIIFSRASRTLLGAT